jgi:hypothetical protein
LLEASPFSFPPLLSQSLLLLVLDMQLHRFAQCVAVVYGLAFASFVYQLDDLYGSDGLLPKEYPSGSTQALDFGEFIRDPQSMLLRSGNLLTVDGGPMPFSRWIYYLCLVSIAVSTLVAVASRGASCLRFGAFVWLFLVYGGLVFHVGETFLSFQWDILLLEVGLVSILCVGSQWLIHERIALPIVLVKVLCFKLLFMSGVVKLQSECPAWWNLSALEYHFATQCIPTPLARIAAQVPPFFLSLSVALTLILQILGSFALLLPLPTPTMMVLQTIGQLIIALTGNYNFFNLLTILLIIMSSESVVSLPAKGKGFVLFNIVSSLVIALGVGSMIGGKVGAPSIDGLLKGDFSDRLKVGLTKTEFNYFVGALALPLAGLFITVTFLIAVISDLVLLFRQTPLRRIRFAVVFCLLLLVSVNLTSANMKTLTELRRTSPGTVSWDLTPWWVQHPEKQLLSYVFHNQRSRDAQLQHQVALGERFVYPYGLFRRMTGVGNSVGEPVRVARPEVVLEASLDGKKWVEYDFYYKPGNVSQPLPWVAPHQPRLDWQMWFQALNPNPEKWFLHLIWKLLANRPLSTHVMPPPPSALRQKAPKFIRALLYEYRFSSANEFGNMIWERKLIKEFVPPISLQHPGLQRLASELGWKK